MSASNDVVVGVVEYDAAPRLAKPARGPVVVVELVVDGAPSRRFADRSSHIPTPSTYDEFARPRFFADAVVVSIIIIVVPVVSIIIVSPISHPLARSRSLDPACRASSSHARRSPRARLPPSSRVVVRRSIGRLPSRHPSRAFRAFIHQNIQNIDPSTDRPIDPSTHRPTDRATERDARGGFDSTPRMTDAVT